MVIHLQLSWPIVSASIEACATSRDERENFDIYSIVCTPIIFFAIRSELIAKILIAASEYDIYGKMIQ